MAPPQAADGQAAGHDAEMNQPLLGDSEPPAESEVNTDMRTNGVFQELSELLSLTTAIFIARVSWVIIKTTDSALLGYTGTEYLAAASISDLWTQSTGVFIMGGVLGMFCSQAIGAGNKELAGIWLQVSLAVLLVVMIPVALSWALTGPLLRALGQPEQIVSNGAYFANILMLCLPARIGISQISQFFTSMKIMHPSMVTSVMAMALNLGLGLLLVLGIGVPGWAGFGFPACPLVTTCVENFQLLVLGGIYWVLMKLYRECWPAEGWSFSHVTWLRVVQFTKVYFPAALALASDFWRVAAIGAVAAYLGPEEVSVFNCSYRVMWICLTFVGSMGGAMAIHVGMALGAANVQQAKKTCVIAVTCCLVLVLALAVVLLFFAKEVARLFSPDPAIHELFFQVRFPMVAMMVLMNMAVVMERIPMAMGRSTVVLVVGLVGSWAGQVPGVLVGVFWWRGDLVGLFTGVAAGYGLLCSILGTVILCSDWDFYVKEAQERSEVAKPRPASNSVASMQPARAGTEESDSNL